MILNINDNKFLIDLQEKFTECFPYLKIEFYDMPCNCGKSLTSDHVLPCHLRLCDCRRIHDPGLLDIKSFYSVGQVEKDFKDLFGLHVQIFRCENNHWVVTNKTKHLTLKQQSDIAQNGLHLAKRVVKVAEEGIFSYQ